MAVIINEFEVVVEPPATEPEAEPGTVPNSETETAQRLNPHDLDTILRQRVERALRLRAH